MKPMNLASLDVLLAVSRLFVPVESPNPFSSGTSRQSLAHLTIQWQQFSRVQDAKNTAANGWVNPCPTGQGSLKG